MDREYNKWELKFSFLHVIDPIFSKYSRHKQLYIPYCLALRMMINIKFCYLLWRSIQQTGNWWKSTAWMCVYTAISFPAKWFRQPLSLGRTQLHPWKCNISAWRWVTASNVERRAADIISATYGFVWHVRNGERRSLIGAVVVEAVELVYDNRV